MTKIYKSRLDWVKSISEEELEKRFKDAKTLAETAKKKISFYEEELERRKKFPLGVPLEDKTLAHHFGVYEFGFTCEESQHVFHERIKGYVETLQKLAKGETIDIKVLTPLLKKGKVLYSPYDEKWKWVEQEALLFVEEHGWYIKRSKVIPIEGFNIKPAEDWKNSLMECGL